RQRFLDNMDAAAERTERLVARLLQLARLENPSSPPETASDTLAAWLDANRDRWGNVVVLDAESAALSCRVHLHDVEAIVGNLVDNALRFRREQPVHVTFGRFEGKLRISVEDDGPGVSQENQQRLFSRFFTTERD